MTWFSQERVWKKKKIDEEKCRRATKIEILAMTQE